MVICWVLRPERPKNAKDEVKRPEGFQQEDAEPLDFWNIPYFSKTSISYRAACMYEEVM